MTIVFIVVLLIFGAGWLVGRFCQEKYNAKLPDLTIEPNWCYYHCINMDRCHSCSKLPISQRKYYIIEELQAHQAKLENK